MPRHSGPSCSPAAAVMRAAIIVALLALCAVLAVAARPTVTISDAPATAASAAHPASHHHTHVASAAPRPQRPVRSTAQVVQAQEIRVAQATSYTPVMAYHPEPQRAPKPLYEAQWDLEDFHTSGAYDTEVSGTLSNAQMLASTLVPANNSVWVFDVDETSLSGYAEMLSIGFGYVAKLNHDWIMESSAPAIPQTLALYQQLVSAGFRIIFLTGRKDIEHDATALNLQKQGYSTFDALVTRIPSEYNMTATDYKSARRTQFVEQQGYNVVGCVGDQWSDLNGPYTGFKVKIPNYIYFLP